MFIYHRIRSLMKEGTAPYLVWMTDGAAHNPELRRMLTIKLTIPILAWKRDEEIRQIRTAESRSLAVELGIPESHLRFLEYPSGQILWYFPQIIRTYTELFQELKPRAIYTVAYEHAGFDHDACNAAVRLAARKLDYSLEVYEWPVVNNYRGTILTHRLIPYQGIPIQRTTFTPGDELERINLYIQKYPSQWSAARAEQFLNFFRTDYQRYGEPFRLMPAYDYTHPMDGAAVMYMPNSLHFDHFKEMILAYLHEHGFFL